MRLLCSHYYYNFFFFFDVWPSMVTHTRNLCSAFNPSKCTHGSEHTHREHTPGAVGSQCCGARGAVGGSVPCSRVSSQSWYSRWRESWILTPPTDNSCRTWDSNPRPSGYKSDSLTIRPRLPHNYEVAVVISVGFSTALLRGWQDVLEMLLWGCYAGSMVIYVFFSSTLLCSWQGVLAVVMRLLWGRDGIVMWNCKGVVFCIMWNVNRTHDLLLLSYAQKLNPHTVLK